MKLKKEYSIAELAESLDAVSFTDKQRNICVKSLATIENANNADVSFLSNPKYTKFLATTKAGVLILDKSSADKFAGAKIIVKDPLLAFARLIKNCVVEDKKNTGIHSTVIIGDDCCLAKDVQIAANVVIGDNVKILAGAIIGANTVIGDNCILGANVEIKPGVVIYPNVEIGNQTVIHSSTVIGSDGFGYANNLGKWEKIIHVGGVRIGNNVEIGSNTSIDRGVLENTTIADDVIIDNLVQVAHNVKIGKATAIAGCVAIAGSAVIGENCLIGGGSAIAGHIELGDNVSVTGFSAVNNSVQKGTYSGVPAKDNLSWRKNIARFNSLDSIVKRLNKLEKKQQEQLVLEKK